MSYELNLFRHKKFGTNYLLTNDYREFVVLNEFQFNIFRNLKLEKDSDIYFELVEKGFILDLDSSGKLEKKYAQKNSNLFRGPSLHIVVPTLRCNFSCTYCHAQVCEVGNLKNDMDEKTADKTIDFILKSPSNIISIEFQGGEPLLNFDIVRYIVENTVKRKNVDKEVRFSIVTNLSLLDEEKIHFLKKNNIDVCTSIDGPKEVHNFSRKLTSKDPNVGSYDSVIKNLNFSKEHGLDISALLVVTKKSLDFGKEIVDEYICMTFKKFN